MTNLNLNAMGVTEMSVKETQITDGGMYVHDTSTADAISEILSLYSAGLISYEEGQNAIHNLR